MKIKLAILAILIYTSVFSQEITAQVFKNEFRLNLASTYIDLKNWQKVKETAQSALGVDANNPMTNMYTTIGLKYTGKESQALQYQEKAKRLEAKQNK